MEYLKKMSESPQQLNSLDCWDYTIELECLRGIEGIYKIIKWI